VPSSTCNEFQYPLDIDYVRRNSRFAVVYSQPQNHFKEYIDQTFSGTEDSFAPGSANHKNDSRFIRANVATKTLAMGRRNKWQMN
jgi:hypothetical protein